MKLRSGIHTGLHTNIINTKNGYGKENITIQLSEDCSDDEQLAQEYELFIWIRLRISKLMKLRFNEPGFINKCRIGYEMWAVIHEHLDFIRTSPIWKTIIPKYITFMKDEMQYLKKLLYKLSFTPEIRNYIGNYRADLVRTLLILEGSS